MIDRTLEDTTSVTVSSDFDEISSDSIVDELVVFRNEFVETFLNDLYHQ